jgi:adenylate kinase family enzyme
VKKVLVIGSCGAGKSVFSRRLGEVSGLPVIHLDRHFWSSGWVKPDRDQWRERVRALLEGESWIIDGNYGATMEMRLEYCDTVIFLDFPRHICTWRVIKRAINYRGRSRPDLADGCPEKLNWDFIKWTWNYPTRSRPHVLERLARIADKVRIVTLSNQGQVEGFLRHSADFAS